MSRLGTVLRNVRVQSYMTIGDLSERSQVHPSLIGKLERGYIPARCPWFINLERALLLPRNTLLDLNREDQRDIVQYDLSELKLKRKARIQQEHVEQGRPSTPKTKKTKLAHVA